MKKNPSWWKITVNLKNKPNKPESKQHSDKVKVYLKYSGMAFQIVAYIIVGILLGKQLDKWVGTDRPYFTAFGAILFLLVFFVKLVKDLKQ